MAFAPGPLPGWSLALVQAASMAVLAGAVWRAPSARAAAQLGFAFGFGTYAAGLYWLYISMHVYGQMASWLAAAAVGLFAAILALFPALAAAVTLRLAGEGRGAVWRFVATWAAAWAGLEWVRGSLFTGFSWLNIGYGHVDSVLAGWAPVFGVYGVAFMAALVAVCLAGAVLLRGRQRWGAIAAGGAVLLAGVLLQPLQWGVVPDGKPIAVRLVQGNVEQSNKFDPDLILAALERHLQLAGQASTQAGFKPDLVLLPETAVPLFQDQLPAHIWQPWIDVARGWDATVATGVPLHTPGADGTSVHTNSVVGLTPDTTPSDLINARLPYRYDKSHLVPFGEFVPTGFRWFVDAMVIPLGDFNRGPKRQPPFDIAGQRIGLNICYEDVFGEELLPAIRSGPNGEPGATILANVSNLGWFGDSWALPQHLQIARMRSIETARPSIRATNTGATAIIDAQGQVQHRLPYHQAGVLDASVQGMTGLTPYTRWGNTAALLLIVAILSLVLLDRRRSPGPSP
nr:apolipoprotein N-acyltransferase [Pseudomonas sp.]